MYAIGQNKQGVHLLLVQIKLKHHFLCVTYGVAIILLLLVVVIIFFALWMI